MFTVCKYEVATMEAHIIVDPFRDDPEMLENPPPNQHISHEDWSEFIKYRLSAEFKVRYLFKV